ncbi:hypothetical protein LIQ82_02265 [Intestinibacter bartlettii]|uniref:hypothetical protein n=1 Tax=Intestinibacter bartlettii TaxID=261299 RepID=UPI0006649EF9|nr:hypothetical protein [Intestinibacter bartlettii]MDU1252959.1 hypothetical protein [Peptostreptococcaceae bacterium]MBS7147722.1 hypothetical protein [Intestinibacter bartlettii]MCB5745112.1 hypothetical protein [Intestinibacter bartlettii]MDU2695041.1 hypothetical protein [Intestinibacter bartlettii]MDU4257061.1 hypothetical protein [Intestinibacter bartlettii]
MSRYFSDLKNISKSNVIIRIKKNNIKAFKLKCFILLKKQDMWIKKNIKQIKIEHLLYFDKIGKAEFIDFLIFLLFVLK